MNRLVLALLLALAGCGGGPAPEEAAADLASASRVRTVYIRDFAFWPERLTVSAGDTVVFKNLDVDPHSATAGGWDTGNLGTGQSRRVVMERSGVYRYHCAPHPSMQGLLEVGG